MMGNSQAGEEKYMEGETGQPRFCQDCGLSLVMLDTWCTSRTCENCGKEAFFVRRGEDGGIRVEKGEKFHIPQITLSLDPATGGQFMRFGLEGFIKQLFLGQKIESKEKVIERFKELEERIDAELRGLDCISHCDLESDAGVEEAAGILEKQGLNEYRFNLFRSGLLRRCYTAIEEGDALDAVYSAYQADIFKEYSLLEHHHLKEIIWLGYGCYVDIVKNEGLTEPAAREKKLIKGATNKIRNLGSEFLYALAKNGSEIAPRLTLSGLSEETLKALVGHELEKRERDRQELLAKEEMKIKRAANSIMLWGFLFTLANGLILALYKDWIG